MPEEGVVDVAEAASGDMTEVLGSEDVEDFVGEVRLL